jgi:hypothetical protein
MTTKFTWPLDWVRQSYASTRFGRHSREVALNTLQLLLCQAGDFNGTWPLKLLHAIRQNNSHSGASCDTSMAKAREGFVQNTRNAAELRGDLFLTRRG